MIKSIMKSVVVIVVFTAILNCETTTKVVNAISNGIDTLAGKACENFKKI